MGQVFGGRDVLANDSAKTNTIDCVAQITTLTFHSSGG